MQQNSPQRRATRATATSAMFTRCLHTGVLLLATLLAGCASIVGNVTQGFADDLSAVVLNSEDPALVRDGAPAFLLLMDGLLGEDSKNADLLASAAALNSAYATAFVSDELRQKLFAVKALRLAERSACVGMKNACELRDREFDQFETWVQTLGERDVPLAYGLATAWAGWIQAHADDWGAIAELGRVKTLMARVAELDPAYEYGGPELYLGVFETLLPPALGGRPEVGRKHFEKAIELAEGRFLPAKVFFASQYARLVFDRELHDELLNDVLGSDPKYDGLTLINLIAKEQARELLESADEYF